MLNFFKGLFVYYQNSIEAILHQFHRSQQAQKQTIICYEHTVKNAFRGFKVF